MRKRALPATKIEILEALGWTLLWLFTALGAAVLGAASAAGAFLLLGVLLQRGGLLTPRMGLPELAASGFVLGLPLLFVGYLFWRVLRNIFRSALEDVRRQGAD